MIKAKYTVAMESIIGTRDEQQDCAFTQVDNLTAIAVVCDGMGGLESGRTASAATIAKFKELHEKKDPAETYPAFFLKAVDILDEFVFHLKDENGERISAGTTLVAAAIESNNLFWLSIGDSRLYILRGNEFARVTRDHNYFLRLDQMRREKEISESQYQAESVRGESLISFVGVGGIEVMDLSNAPFNLLPNDTILLTTDGLYKTLSDEEIKHCLYIEDVNESITALINTANEKALPFQDNTTCVIIRCNEEVFPNEAY